MSSSGCASLCVSVREFWKLPLVLSSESLHVFSLQFLEAQTPGSIVPLFSIVMRQRIFSNYPPSFAEDLVTENQLSL